MGYPPPVDAPSVADQDIASANASFKPGPDAVSICGFKFPPKFNFSFGFNLPPLPPFPPTFNFNFSLGINCSGDGNPFNVAGGVSFGGNRTSTGPRDPDDKDAEDYEKAATK
jgi:hypothetical protein